MDASLGFTSNKPLDCADFIVYSFKKIYCKLYTAMQFIGAALLLKLYVIKFAYCLNVNRLQIKK